jgi:hypothetical protein
MTATTFWRRIAGTTLLALTFFSGTARAAGGLVVVYPARESAQDIRYDDLIEILHGALEHTVAHYGPYRMRPSHLPMTEARQLVTLENGGGDLDILWSSTSDDKERLLLPIRIPLRKGLLGYRIGLIAQGTQPLFDAVNTRAGLHRFVVGQGIGWGDVGIYNRNGLKVSTAPYDKLFRMLAMRRITLFPRGIGEAFKEYAAQGGPASGLAIEQHLLLVYPWPYYFFVRKNNPALARRIETGIRSMIKDGSFDVIFRKYNGADIARARLASRRIIRLDNPFLPTATPLHDPSLWFDPTRAD